jgi:release factor glutamine methyltransferase
MEAPAIKLDVRNALKEGIARLGAANVPSHTLAAELLLMHALGRDRAWLYSHPEEEVAPAVAREFLALVTRRAGGEPTQYLTGKQEFWGLEFEVTPAVLIPRPETEHVVEVAVERLRAGAQRGSIGEIGKGTSVRIADVGTGSGCLAIALAHELPKAEIFATDISEAALEVARRNAARHGVSRRVHFQRCNLLDAFSGDAPFDLIVSNPPYIGRREAGELPREVRDHEPEAALFGGVTGVEIYSRVVDQAARMLRPGGLLVVELGYNSSPHVRKIFERDVRWTNVSVTLDLAGIERVLAARLS